MEGLVADLVRIAFEDRVPATVVGIWPGPLADRHALAFKACPILPIGHDAPPRMYVSNGFEDDTGFITRVAAAFHDPRIATFLGQLGPGARKIVDTDGISADCFLDDLQYVDHQLDVPEGLDLLASTLRVPDGWRTLLSRHGAAPVALLDGAWAARLDAVHAAGLTGHWAIRWGPGGIASLLLVNEARWSGRAEASAQRLDALGDARWLACRARAHADGLAAYPDAIEVKDTGWDVTVGLFDPKDPASRAAR